MPVLNLGPTIEKLDLELEKLKASDDPEDQKRAMFFERIGVFVWALIVNEVPPPIIGITTFDWLQEIGAVQLEKGDGEHCDPTLHQEEECGECPDTSCPQHSSFESPVQTEGVTEVEGVTVFPLKESDES